MPHRIMPFDYSSMSFNYAMVQRDGRFDYSANKYKHIFWTIMRERDDFYDFSNGIRVRNILGGDVLIAVYDTLNNNYQHTGLLKSSLANDFLLVYPNPGSSIIEVELKNIQGLMQVEIYDLAGRLLQNINTIAPGKAALDISGLAPGNYIIKAFGESGSASQMLMKR